MLLKLKDARTGDTLCDRDVPIVLPEFKQHSRPVAFAVHAKAGDDKAAAALHKLIEEDPSLELVRNPDTAELLIKGMGQAHIEVTVERVKRKHGVEVALAPPTPSYLETITTTAKAQGKFKRQTGGHGQYGDAHVELSPLPRGAGFEFEDAIVGGAIPRQFIPSVEKGIRGAIGAGPLAGYQVVDFSAKLVFGTYHDVDSSDMAFQVAGSMAFKKAVMEARPILLEPIMSLEVRVPEEYVGAVMGDLNSRRAKVQGMEPAARGVDDQGALPARRGDELRRGAPLAHPRRRVLHDGALSLRAGPAPDRAEDHREAARGREGEGGRGIARRAVQARASRPWPCMGMHAGGFALGWRRLALLPPHPRVHRPRIAGGWPRPSAAWPCCRSRPPSTSTCSARCSTSSSPGRARRSRPSAGSSRRRSASTSGFGRSIARGCVLPPRRPVIAVALVKGVAYFGQFFLMGMVSQRVVADIRRALFDHVLTLSPSFFAKRHSGELLSRFSSDVGSIEMAATNAVASYIRDGLTIVVMLVNCFILDWRLSLMAFGAVPLTLLPDHPALEAAEEGHGPVAGGARRDLDGDARGAQRHPGGAGLRDGAVGVGPVRRGRTSAGSR